MTGRPNTPNMTSPSGSSPKLAAANASTTAYASISVSH